MVFGNAAVEKLTSIRMDMLVKAAGVFITSVAVSMDNVTVAGARMAMLRHVTAIVAVSMVTVAASGGDNVLVTYAPAAVRIPAAKEVNIIFVTGFVNITVADTGRESVC